MKPGENFNFTATLLTNVGPPPVGYPDHVDPTWFDGPAGLTYGERREWFLNLKASRPAPPVLKGFYSELARLQLNLETDEASHGLPETSRALPADVPPVHENLIESVLDYIDARHDCADFLMLGITRLLFQYGRGVSEPGRAISGELSPALLTRSMETILNFKYHPSEPGIDSMCTWTENHAIMFATSDYLHSCHFADEVFSNSGEPGRDRVGRARRRICRWLLMRFQTGFSEWLSHVYLDEDIMALLNLVDFAPDDHVRDGARAVLDLLFTELASVVFRGAVATSHGRSYSTEKRFPYLESIADTIYLAFGQGGIAERDNMSAVGLALSGYRCPTALSAIADPGDSASKRTVTRQRCGITVREASRWGINPADNEGMMELLTMEAYAHPHTIRHFIRLLGQYRWWQNDFFASFAANRSLLSRLDRPGLLKPVARLLRHDISRNTREAANVLTVRTPHYQLSCAQDYRAGYGGDQQHIWQAALSRRASVFTTHPGGWGEGSVSFWTGSGVLPRAILVGRCVVCLYRLHAHPAIYHRNRLMFTHAWFPVSEFDEVRSDGNWVFARAGEGYLGLYCSGETEWYRFDESARPVEAPIGPGGPAGAVKAVDRSAPARLGDDEEPNELRCHDRRVVWICEAGSAEHGEFEAFCRELAARPIRVETAGPACPKVIFDSPSAGRIELGWRGLIWADGAPLSRDDYPRLANQYVSMNVGDTSTTISAGGEEHVISLPAEIARPGGADGAN